MAKAATQKPATAAKKSPAKSKSPKAAKSPAKASKSPAKAARSPAKSPKEPRPLTGYVFFSNLKRPEVSEQNPDAKMTEVVKKLGEMWRALSKDEQASFKAQSKADFDAKGPEQVAAERLAKKMAINASRRKKVVEADDKPAKGADNAADAASSQAESSDDEDAMDADE